MWKYVYVKFRELTKSEQMALFDAMKQDLFPEVPDKITILLNTIHGNVIAQKQEQGVSMPKKMTL